MENMNMNALQMKKLILESPNVVCECGSKTFTTAYVLKKIPALMSGTGKEELTDIPVYVCSKCGNVPDEVKHNANYAQIFGESDNSTIVK